MQLPADLRDSLSDEIAFFVQYADFHGALAAALDLTADSGHEHGPAANGFAVVLFVVKAHIEIPPVVKQGDEVRTLTVTSMSRTHGRPNTGEMLPLGNEKAGNKSVPRPWIRWIGWRLLQSGRGAGAAAAQQAGSEQEPGKC